MPGWLRWITTPAPLAEGVLDPKTSLSTRAGSIAA